MSDGGPAFPGKHTEVRRVFYGRQQLGFGEHQDHYSEQEVEVLHSGMSLRDYFAAKAMQSFILTDANRHPDHRLNSKVIALMAYGYADAMLEARDKQP